MLVFIRMRTKKKRSPSLSSARRQLLHHILLNTPEIGKSFEKKRRTYYGRGNWKESTWWRSYFSDNNTHHDPNTRAGKLFRRRFRVPLPLFVEIVAICKASDKFSKKERDCCGNETVPIELMVLAALRLLGRGITFDGVAEVTNVSEETCRLFFHKFCAFWGIDQFENYVFPPSDDADIANIVGEYEKLGFPGCIGSADVTHIPWDRAPAGLIALYTGKEKIATLAYEVACTHRRRIISCTSGFPGSRNDKYIVRYDSFIQSLHNGAKYRDNTFELRSDTETISTAGFYLLVDNGYHRWRELQNPIKRAANMETAQYSKWLESVRKDIECTFGILKGRFRILKIPMLLQKQDQIDNVFKTCCVLHNMILAYNGRDQWEHNIDYEGVDGEHEEHDVNTPIHVLMTHIEPNGTTLRREMVELRITRDMDLTRLGERALPVEDPETENELTHSQLQRQLIKHFTLQWKDHKLVWS